MAIVGLGLPVILCVHLFFLVYWVFRKRFYYTFFALAILCLGLPIWKDFIAFQPLAFINRPSPETQGDSAIVKIMSYNVKNFDLYNWTENIEARDRMLDLIEAEDPHIIAFQEFYTEEKENAAFHNIKLLVNELGYTHYHFEKTLTLENTNHWGVAVFSKYPLTRKSAIKFEETINNAVAYVDVAIGTQKIRLYNAHLQSIYLGRKDLKYVKDIAKEQEIEKHIQSSRSILKKLRDAFKKRSKQAEALARHIKQSPYPVVVCGDFNDPPFSYTYQTISRNLQDAFLATGLGIGATYAGPLPALRIDYLLLDPSFEVRDFNVIKKDYSDHYPITTTFNLEKK